ncbi:hypothetical protein ACFE04_014764 [Oxalis oulophora]
MDRGKSKRKDTLAATSSTRNTEPQYTDLNGEPNFFNDIPNLNIPLPPSPTYFADLNMLQPNSQELLLPDIDVADYPFDDSEVLFRNLDLISTLNDEQNPFQVSNAKTHVNVQSNQIDRSYTTARTNALECLQMSRQNPIGFELPGNSAHLGNSTPVLMNSTIPSSYHTMLREGFSPTVGNIATRPNMNVQSRDIPQQTDWSSPFDLVSCNLSSPPNMAHGLISPMQNVGGSHGNSLAQWPSYNNFQALPNTNNMLNPRLSHLSPVQPFGNGPSLANSDLYRGLLTYQPISSATFSVNQVRTPHAGPLSSQQRPLYSPLMTGGTMQSVYRQPQESYARPVANLNSQQTAVYPFGVGNAKQDQSDRSIPLTQGSSAQVTRQFLNMGVQQAGNLNQPQVVIQGVQALGALRPPTGPPTPAEINSGPAQASGRPVRRSRKRAVPQQAVLGSPEFPLRAVRPRASSTVPICPPSVQTRPSVRPLAQTRPSVRLLAQTLRPATALRSYLPPLGTTGPFVHIKRTVPEPTPEPEEKCFLCKRNVQYAPKGPYVKPTNPLIVAVLSCGHVFHDECLANITPESEAKNPPCIPCAMGVSSAVKVLAVSEYDQGVLSDTSEDRKQADIPHVGTNRIPSYNTNGIAKTDELFGTMKKAARGGRGGGNIAHNPHPKEKNDAITSTLILSNFLQPIISLALILIF